MPILVNIAHRGNPLRDRLVPLLLLSMPSIWGSSDRPTWAVLNLLVLHPAPTQSYSLGVSVAGKGGHGTCGNILKCTLGRAHKLSFVFPPLASGVTVTLGWVNCLGSPGSHSDEWDCPRCLRKYSRCRQLSVNIHIVESGDDLFVCKPGSI